MKKIFLFLLCIYSYHAIAQTDSLKEIREITAFQKKLNEEYKNLNESPLELDDFKSFQSHDFFPIDLRYRVNAKLTVTDATPFFPMKTTTSQVSLERVYGYVTFSLTGTEFRLPVYQSKDLMQTDEYADYLFFPFNDETNGKQTYDGGRYIDLRIPKEGNDVVIDFNMAYNPYCAYSPRFSCPLVPAENQMDIEVPVGVRYQKKEKKKFEFRTDDRMLISPEVMPEYPGGAEAMAKFITSNLKYPKEAAKKRIQGKVFVEFVVEADGSISSIKTLKGISKECDREAERVISLMPRWKPGQTGGENVPTRFVMPINFKGRAGWTK